MIALQNEECSEPWEMLRERDKLQFMNAMQLQNELVVSDNDSRPSHPLLCSRGYMVVAPEHFTTTGWFSHAVPTPCSTLITVKSYHHNA